MSEIRLQSCWCHQSWQADKLWPTAQRDTWHSPLQLKLAHTPNTHTTGLARWEPYLARFSVKEPTWHKQLHWSNNVQSIALSPAFGQTRLKFWSLTSLPLLPLFTCSGLTEKPDGGAPEESAAWWHQGVQVTWGSPATGLYRAGGGEHLAAEAGLHAQTEPGENGAVLQNVEVMWMVRVMQLSSENKKRQMKELERNIPFLVHLPCLTFIIMHLS